MIEEQKILFEKNNDIAKFLGWRIDILIGSTVGDYNYIEWVDKYDETIYSGRNDKSLIDEEGFDYSPPFDLDWYLLIYAVEHIESLGYKVKICRKRVQICPDTKEEVPYVDVKTDSKRKSVYEAIHQFILIRAEDMI